MKNQISKFINKYTPISLRTEELADIKGKGCTYLKYVDPNHGYIILEVETGIMYNIIGNVVGQMPYSGTCPGS